MTTLEGILEHVLTLAVDNEGTFHANDMCTRGGKTVLKDISLHAAFQHPFSGCWWCSLGQIYLQKTLLDFYDIVYNLRSNSSTDQSLKMSCFLTCADVSTHLKDEKFQSVKELSWKDSSRYSLYQNKLGKSIILIAESLIALVEETTSLFENAFVENFKSSAQAFATQESNVLLTIPSLTLESCIRSAVLTKQCKYSGVDIPRHLATFSKNFTGIDIYESYYNYIGLPYYSKVFEANNLYLLYLPRDAVSLLREVVQNKQVLEEVEAKALSKSQLEIISKMWSDATNTLSLNELVLISQSF